MSMSRVTVAVAALSLVLLGSGVSTASAIKLESTYGPNRAYVSDDYYKVYACDNVADGDTAYADGELLPFPQYDFRVDDLAGSGSSCYTQSQTSVVGWNRVCLDWNNRPDPCGSKKYHPNW